MKKSWQEWHRHFVLAAMAVVAVTVPAGSILARNTAHETPDYMPINQARSSREVLGDLRAYLKKSQSPDGSLARQYFAAAALVSGHPVAVEASTSAPTQPASLYAHPCAPINNVPATDAYKVWNDFRASLKNALTINADLSLLADKGVKVCMIDPKHDLRGDAGFMYGILGTVVAYNFTAHELYVDSALPKGFNPRTQPVGLKTLPQQIASTLPIALNDALMNVQYGTTGTSFWGGLGKSPTSATSPEARINQIREESTIDNIMLMRRYYDLAQAGYDYHYKTAEKIIPEFMSVFEAKFVHAPATQPVEDRLWAVFKTVMQDKGQQLTVLGEVQDYLAAYERELGARTVPPKDFKQGYDPASDIERVADSASYLQPHAGELGGMMLSLLSPPADPAIHAALGDVLRTFMHIEYPQDQEEWRLPPNSKAPSAPSPH